MLSDMFCHFQFIQAIASAKLDKPNLTRIWTAQGWHPTKFRVYFFNLRSQFGAFLSNYSKFP